MTLGIGIDTGGTFTDIVIIDLKSEEVLRKSKSPTTPEDLSIGIRNAMSFLDRVLLTHVSVVSLSSTLATNSVVEGKGCRVALTQKHHCISQISLCRYFRRSQHKKYRERIKYTCPRRQTGFPDQHHDSKC